MGFGKLRSVKSIKLNSNWKPKKFRSVKSDNPNWMEDVEGVKLLA